MCILINVVPTSASTCGLSLPEGALLQSSGEHFVSNFVGGPVQFSMTCPDNDMIVTFTAMRMISWASAMILQCQPAEEQIMPRVIACLLRHLPLLQVQLVGLCNTIVISSFHWIISSASATKYALTFKTSIDIMIDKVVDLANLHPGIEHYYRGTSNSKWHLMLKVVKAWWKEKCFIRWCQLPLFARRRRPAAPPRLRQAAQPGPLHRLRSSCSGEHCCVKATNQHSMPTQI